MKSISLVMIVLSINILSCSTNKNQDDKKDAGEWVSLFNGKDMDNWIVKIAGYELGENYGNTFRVEGGLLKVRYDKYDGYNNRFGALYYKNKFSNYRLKIEYRFVGDTASGAPVWGFRDSGVQYHCQDPSSLKTLQSFPVCLEYNLHGGNGTDERPVGQICASGIYIEMNGKRNESYCTPATIKRTIHGDQWATLEIDVHDGIYRHFINEEEILLFENPRYDPSHEFAGNLIKEEDNVVKDGWISLQSNSHPIDFRKIEIMEY